MKLLHSNATDPCNGTATATPAGTAASTARETNTILKRCPLTPAIRPRPQFSSPPAQIRLLFKMPHMARPLASICAATPRRRTPYAGPIVHNCWLIIHCYCALAAPTSPLPWHLPFHARPGLTRASPSILTPALSIAWATPRGMNARHEPLPHARRTHAGKPQTPHK